MPCGSENVTGILPTANMCLQGVNCMKSIARVLFDTGAQKSYVIKSLVDKLKIEPFKYKSLKIEGFNCIKEAASYPVVNLCSIVGQEKICFEAHVVENLPNKICMPGRDVLIQNLLSSGIKLADISKGDMCTNLEIVVGIDNIFKFFYHLYILFSVHFYNRPTGAVCLCPRMFIV